jgi:hypothetical protein
MAVRAGREQIERSACDGLQIFSDFLDRDDAQAELVNLSYSPSWLVGNAFVPD